MAEINNSLPNFGINLDKIEKTNGKKSKEQEPVVKEEVRPEQNYVPDTGVLGRSQVKVANGGNIDKSVQEAVNMAIEHPELMHCGETVFDCLYNDFIEQGMSPSDAYMKALLGEEEFNSIGMVYNR